MTPAFRHMPEERRSRQSQPKTPPFFETYARILTTVHISGPGVSQDPRFFCGRQGGFCALCAPALHSSAKMYSRNHQGIPPCVHNREYFSELQPSAAPRGNPASAHPRPAARRHPPPQPHAALRLQSPSSLVLLCIIGLAASGCGWSGEYPGYTPFSSYPSYRSLDARSLLPRAHAPRHKPDFFTKKPNFSNNKHNTFSPPRREHRHDAPARPHTRPHDRPSHRGHRG